MRTFGFREVQSSGLDKAYNRKKDSFSEISDNTSINTFLPSQFIQIYLFWNIFTGLGKLCPAEFKINKKCPELLWLFRRSVGFRQDTRV